MTLFALTITFICTLSHAQDLTVMDQAVFAVRKMADLPSFNFLVEDKDSLAPAELQITVSPREILPVPLEKVRNEYQLHTWFGTDPGYIGTSLPTAIEAFALKQRFGILTLTGEMDPGVRTQIFTELSSLVRFGRFVNHEPDVNLTKLSFIVKIMADDFLAPQVTGENLLRFAKHVDRIGPYAFVSFGRRQLSDMIYSGCSRILTP